jgi:hypothetical protein
MIETVLSIADQNVLLLSEIYHDIKPIYFKEGSNPNLLLRYVKTTEKIANEIGRANFESYPGFFTYQSMIFRDSSLEINTHGLAMTLAYLADMNSKKYSSIHGCGMIIKSGNKEKGILLVGRHGSGKSTLENALRKNCTLDDDVLMIDDTSMQTVGKYGSITYKEKSSKQKMRRHLINGVTESKMDAIFILDKQYCGGYLKEEEWQIPRKDSAIDALGYSLYTLWKERPPIKVNVPVYRLGTDMNISGTKCMILSVL